MLWHEAASQVPLQTIKTSHEINFALKIVRKLQRRMKSIETFVIFHIWLKTPCVLSRAYFSLDEKIRTKFKERTQIPTFVASAPLPQQLWGGFPCVPSGRHYEMFLCSGLANTVANVTLLI